jgi:hypothetical protein
MTQPPPLNVQLVAVHTNDLSLSDKRSQFSLKFQYFVVVFIIPSDYKVGEEGTRDFRL